ncbi:hypothetical protein EC991_004945 [Linnemannia zychae]|nr:hypothetical protein EC991_004945 [Linnemannia zychae]
MSSSTSAPSTTTTSSLSRADSLSSIEYLQGSHPLHHSHANRHLSGSVNGSATTGSTTGSSFGHSVASGSVSSGGSSSVFLHHSTGLGRANLNAAIRHQRSPHDPAASPTTGSSRTGGDASSTAAADGGQRANGKSGSTTASGSAGTEQGRNSTKRAAQNRAAQRAFRQRKDLYVRELERKAELLQQAEGKILRLTARNRELEVALATGNPSSSSSLSPQQSPIHSHSSPVTGLVGAAGSSPSSVDQEQQQPSHQPHQTLGHSLSREQLDRGGSEWSRNEKPSSLSSRDPEFFDNSSSNQSGHSHPPTLSRATLGRRSASQPMRSAYNASSSPLTNDSLKFHSLKQQLAANQHLSQPHSQSRHPQQQHRHPQHAPSRVDSDFEFENHDPSPHRQLHRHPSEPSLNQNRRGSNSADSGDDYATSGGQNNIRRDYPQDLSRDQGPRCSSVDSRMELTSPVSSNQQSLPLTYRSSNSINTGSRLLPSEYPESSSPPSSGQPYTSNNSQQQHERPPLYPIATQAGPRPPLGSARSWSTGTHQEDGMKPHSPMMTSPVTGRNGGMATSAPSPPRGYGPGNTASRGNDMEYLSDERSETGGDGFDVMSKRSSDGAISWSGSNSSGGRGGGPPGPEPQSSPHAFFGGGPGLRKETSWSSFSAITKGSNDGYNSNNGAGGHSPVSLPPVSALAAATAERERGMGDDMDMQETYHHSHPSQHLHQSRDGERQSSGSEMNGSHHRGSMTMMTDSPDKGSLSEGRFHSTPSSVTTPQMPGRQQQQQQYFSSQQHRSSPFTPQKQQDHQHHPQQQQQRQHHPLSPANEYPPPPTAEMDGVYDHQQQHHQHAQHQAQPRFHNSPNNHSGIAAGYHEEAMMRSP